MGKKEMIEVLKSKIFEKLDKIQKEFEELENLQNEEK